MGDALGSNQFSSVTQLYLTLCNPMDCSTPGLPVHHRLLEFTQTHVYSFQRKQPCRHCWDQSRFRTLGSQVGPSQGTYLGEAWARELCQLQFPRQLTGCHRVSQHTCGALGEQAPILLLLFYPWAAPLA